MSPILEISVKHERHLREGFLSLFGTGQTKSNLGFGREKTVSDPNQFEDNYKRALVINDNELHIFYIVV